MATALLIIFAIMYAVAGIGTSCILCKGAGKPVFCVLAGFFWPFTLYAVIKLNQ